MTGWAQYWRQMTTARAMSPWPHQTCLNFTLLVFKRRTPSPYGWLITGIKFMQSVTTEPLLCAGPSVQRKPAVYCPSVSMFALGKQPPCSYPVDTVPHRAIIYRKIKRECF